MINQEYCPILVNDIEVFAHKKLFGKKHCFYVGSRLLDVCCVISDEIAEVFRYYIPLCNGGNTIVEIEQILMNKNIKVDVLALSIKMASLGLIKDVLPDKNKIVSEAEITMKNIFTICVKNNTKGIYRYIFTLVTFSVILCTLVAIIFLVVNFRRINFHIGRVDIISYMSSLIITLLFHELMHIAVASTEGVRISTVSLAQHFSFIPTIYIKYININFAKSGTRFRIAIAGVLGNLLLLLIFICAQTIDISSGFSYAMIMRNFSMIFACLVPTGLCDGYFALAEILGQYNIRITLLNAIVKKEFSVSPKTKRISLIYLILSSVYILISFVIGIAVEIEMFISGSSLLRIIMLLLTITASVYLLIRAIKKMIYIRKEAENYEN